jgi:hypothetical protein
MLGMQLWNLGFRFRQAYVLDEHGEADEQDCLYGVEKAMETQLLDMTEFDPKTYRFFETVE